MRAPFLLVEMRGQIWQSRVDEFFCTDFFARRDESLRDNLLTEIFMRKEKKKKTMRVETLLLTEPRDSIN
jgi:hypothetical protein